MVDVVSGIVATIAVIILDIFLTLIMMGQVRQYAKSKWNKNKSLYPYFSYPVYKKVFFVGLKGALSRSAVILTFFAHIVTILSIIFCVWMCITQNLTISYCSRISSGIGLFLFLLRCGCQLAFPLNF